MQPTDLEEESSVVQETTKEAYDSFVKSTIYQTDKVSKDDFSLISVIGTGSYGKVLLVRKKGSDSFYAMKVIKKKHIRQNKQVQHTWNERKILEKISSPFVVKMRYAF